MAKHALQLKRVYDALDEAQGHRFLVDRLWPRGVKKSDLTLDGWLKEAAPSDALRKWFHAHPSEWEEFARRYREELAAHPEHWQPLLEAAKRGPVTLLFSARDEEHNNARVLQQFLEEKL